MPACCQAAAGPRSTRPRQAAWRLHGAGPRRSRAPAPALARMQAEHGWRRVLSPGGRASGRPWLGGDLPAFCGKSRQRAWTKWLGCMGSRQQAGGGERRRQAAAGAHPPADAAESRAAPIASRRSTHPVEVSFRALAAGFSSGTSAVRLCAANRQSATSRSYGKRALQANLRGRSVSEENSASAWPSPPACPAKRSRDHACESLL